MDDLEEIDELFTADETKRKSQHMKQPPSLQDKLKKYEEVMGDDL